MFSLTESSIPFFSFGFSSLTSFLICLPELFLSGKEKKRNFILGAGIGLGLGMLFAPKSGEENRKELKQIIKEHSNVLAIFSGHQHWTKHVVEEGISYYVLGSMTENINNDGIPDGVYFVIEFDDEKLEDAIRDISIPGTEELVTVIFQNAKVLDDINLTLNDILKELKMVTAKLVLRKKKRYFIKYIFFYFTSC